MHVGANMEHPADDCMHMGARVITATCAGISSEERAALEAGQSSSAGVAALVVAAGASTLVAATAAAALSCEALQAQVCSMGTVWLQAAGHPEVDLCESCC